MAGIEEHGNLCVKKDGTLNLFPNCEEKGLKYDFISRRSIKARQTEVLKEAVNDSER